MIVKATNIYGFTSEKFVRSEKQLTLREWFGLGKELLPGMRFSLKGESSNETFYLGDATPYHQPSDNDGGFGWDMDHPRMSMLISEVHMPCFTSRPDLNEG